ncbi:heat-inducible transcriptional repressor HrcA [Paeniglutamicibacter cryotolerans]|uniref:Heat-inducible transcription repressor HrcA n=1 Tax=Paeniglutamicibacter cryotolerans TaxID=670079 RepID=A0A839QMQ6_9MICC|nr:heat-inducible transcriptional repressor HrcA [Paeniglutamicibacter cryotolerans]MBB2997177.1 heat-inducible transcriptional repressor [Paeniglutamicibacter cryotolerans]
MSEPRRLEVLRAIVEDYVHSREPVGSKALVERHGLGVSAATIRNDMAALEDEGLIVAPHTSSGRIPTERGYRRFVDRIEDVKPLSGAERRAISSLLEGSSDLNEVLENTVRLLAQITHQVAVIQVPLYSDAAVRHIELVGLGGGQALVVLISTRGTVDQRVIALSGEVSTEDLYSLRDAMLGAVSGARLTELARAAQNAVDLLEPRLRGAAQALASALCALSRNSAIERMVMAGTANLARSTSDFPLSITPVLEALEEQVVLLRLFSELEEDGRGMSVSIGSENAHGSLSGASVVATGYGPGEHAKIGVLGPTRMDYPASMAAVRAVARYLSRILAG